MSDTTQTDPALAMVHKQISLLDAEIALHKHRMETATAVRDSMRELLAEMTRKLRPRNTRAPRVVETDKPANDTNDTPRPTVFALPANDPVGEAEAA